MSPTEIATEDRMRSNHALAAAVVAELPPLPPPALGLWRIVAGEVLNTSRSGPVVRWIITDRGEDDVEQFSIVGKVYDTGGGAAAHALLTRLAEENFGGPYDLARSLGYLPDRSLLLQTGAPPDTLHSLLADPATGRSAVRRTGGWLARLHAVADSDLAPLPADFEAIRTSDFVDGISAVHPELSADLDRLREGILPALANAAAGALVLTHGDLQPKNVHCDADRVVVVDFDRAALAPAARDLGHFIGRSLTSAAALGQDFDGPIACWQRELTKGYLSEGGALEALPAVPAYVARTVLEVLHQRLVVRPTCDLSTARYWLQAASTCVERT